MAYLDSADLLARCKALAQRPTTDEDMSDAQWYSFLTEAQDYWTKVLAQHDPKLLSGAPTALTTSDSGYTYTFGTTPIAVVELTDGKGGWPMFIGPYWDPATDFTWEGSTTLRSARNVARTFTNGLYARWVPQPGVIDGSTQPTLPTEYRLLLPARACVLYARRGGYRDPEPFLAEEQYLWRGDGVTDIGLLGMLKKRAWMQSSSGQAQRVPFWRAGSMNI